MSKPIILYDIPGTNEEFKAWSPNVWLARLALNIKKLPYTTEWVEYPDIQALYTDKLHILPKSKNDDGSPYYTLPVIYDPSTDQAISETFLIVEYLDAQYPSPLAHRLIPPKSKALMRAFSRAISPRIWGPIAWFVNRYPTYQILTSERSKDFFRKSREADLEEGKKLEDLIPTDEERKAGLEKLRIGLENLGQWIDLEGPDSVYVMGDEVSLADCYVIASIAWVRGVIGTESDVWKGTTSWEDGRWERYFNKFKDEGFLAIH
ncbi:hypothetical protein C8Q75DRAFT_808612 [Abortiporus biennis]|nr:hypothetical protein C8Q75DRAFT_808612 [Abortiporus biennis]